VRYCPMRNPLNSRDGTRPLVLRDSNISEIYHRSPRVATREHSGVLTTARFSFTPLPPVSRAHSAYQRILCHSTPEQFRSEARCSYRSVGVSGFGGTMVPVAADLRQRQFLLRGLEGARRVEPGDHGLEYEAVHRSQRAPRTTMRGVLTQQERFQPPRACDQVPRAGRPLGPSGNEPCGFGGPPCPPSASIIRSQDVSQRFDLDISPPASAHFRGYARGR
jgi:hypothetical protein